jgi:hypothetical protein
MIGALAQGIGAASLSGWLGFEGQRQANRSNRQIAREASVFNREEAERDRLFQNEQNDDMKDFQERMSSTAYQRGMKDMEQAGLNPMLAFTQGGASSPQGGAGSGSTAQAVTHQMENEMSGLSTSAAEGAKLGLTYRRLKQEIGNMKENEKLTKAQKKKTEMETRKLKKEAIKGDIVEDVFNKFYPEIFKKQKSVPRGGLR